MFVFKSDVYLILQRQKEYYSVVGPTLCIELMSPTVGSKSIWSLVTECGWVEKLTIAMISTCATEKFHSK